MARTRLDIFSVVLGPWVENFTCEAFDRKLGQKPKSELKEIELVFLTILIYLQKTII